MKCDNIILTIPSVSSKSISLLRRSGDHYIRKATLDILEPGDSIIVSPKIFFAKDWQFLNYKLDDRYDTPTLRALRSEKRKIIDHCNGHYDFTNRG